VISLYDIRPHRRGSRKNGTDDRALMTEARRQKSERERRSRNIDEGMAILEANEIKAMARKRK
jgi:hypothetical protein